MFYTQTNRDLKIDVIGFNCLGDGQADILLESIESAQMGISETFKYELKLVTPEYLDLEKNPMIGRTARVMFRDNNTKDWVCFSGMITQIAYSGSYTYESDNQTYRNSYLRQYRATFEPSMSLLRQSNNTRAFHNQTAIDIVTEILTEWNIKPNFNDVDQEHIHRLNQCVQYQESDFDFISRLMEQEGIYYTFEQSGAKDSDRIEELVTFTNRQKLGTAPAALYQHGECDSFYTFSTSQKVIAQTNRVSNYDYKAAAKPFLDYNKSTTNQATYIGDTTDLMTNVTNTAPFTNLKENSDKEAYNNHLQELATGREVCASYNYTGKIHAITSTNTELGTSINIQLLPLTRFDLGAFDNGAVCTLVTKIAFSIQGAPYTEEGGYIAHNEVDLTMYGQDYNVPFIPQLTTKVPCFTGTTTATVTTGSTKTVEYPRFNKVIGDIPTAVDQDNVTVNLLMNWKNLKDDQQTPDLTANVLESRFNQMWADPNSGKFEAPRNGQEVIVTFTNGNVNQPVIIGGLYNSINKPPVDLANNASDYIMRAATVSENAAAVPSEDTMPIPMSVYDLANPENQKGFNQIALNVQDNKVFNDKPLILSDGAFIMSCLFPAPVGLLLKEFKQISDLFTPEAEEDKIADGFEGINMYSNKDILAQSTQSQFINAGRDIKLTAANAIVFEVGRSIITINDSGISVTNRCSALNKDAGKSGTYTEDAKDYESIPILSGFDSSLTVKTGSINSKASQVKAEGVTNVEMKTMAGSMSIDKTETKITGIKTIIKGGAGEDFKSKMATQIITEMVHLALEELQESKVKTGLEVIVTGILGAVLGKKIYDSTKKTINNIKNMGLYSTQMVMDHKTVEMDGAIVELNASETKIKGDALGGYKATIDELNRRVGGIGGRLGGLIGETNTAMTQMKVKVAEIESNTPKKTETTGESTQTTLAKADESVESVETKGSETSAAIATEGTQVVKEEASVEDAKQAVSQTTEAASVVLATGATSEAAAMKTPAVAADIGVKGMSVE